MYIYIYVYNWGILCNNGLFMLFNRLLTVMHLQVGKIYIPGTHWFLQIVPNSESVGLQSLGPGMGDTKMHAPKNRNTFWCWVAKLG